MTSEHCIPDRERVTDAVEVAGAWREGKLGTRDFRRSGCQSPLVANREGSGVYLASAAPAIKDGVPSSRRSFSGLGVMVFVGAAFVLDESRRNGQSSVAAGRLELDPDAACHHAARDRYFSGPVFDDLYAG